MDKAMKRQEERKERGEKSIAEADKCRGGVEDPDFLLPPEVERKLTCSTTPPRWDPRAAFFLRPHLG